MLPIVDADGHLDEIPEEIVQYFEPPLKGRTEIGRSHGLFPSWNSLEHRSRMFFSGKSYSRYRQDPRPEHWLEFAEMANIEQAILYPTGGLGFAQLADPRLSVYIAKAYNSWAHDRYMATNDRFNCMAILPLHNIPEAVEELRRAREQLGMRGVVMHAGGLAEPLGDKMYWPVYEAAEATDTFVGVHGGGGERGRDLIKGLPGNAVSIISHPTRLMAELVSMMFEGVFEAFPRLKTGFMEAGCGWVPYMMDRMDERWAGRSTATLKKAPSDYLRDCPIYFPAEPYESSLPSVVSMLGAAHLFCSSDFPHEGDEKDTLAHLEEWERVDSIGGDDLQMILTESARAAYSLEKPT